MAIFCGTWPVAVCSWSFQKGIDETATAMTAMGVDHIHLALAPALGADGRAYLEKVRSKRWRITATMLNFGHEDYSTPGTIRKTGGIAPDRYWQISRDLFEKAVRITAGLGVPYISLHVGFLNPGNKEYEEKIIARVRVLGDLAAASGISLLMETGQETADELALFLKTLSHDHVFLNFDPANLILYGKDEPLRALAELAPWIRHAHIKDAVRPASPGTWGTEVPWGDGEVNPFVFLNQLKKSGYQGALAIEREAGENRVKDIALAARRLKAW